MVIFTRNSLEFLSLGNKGVAVAGDWRRLPSVSLATFPLHASALWVSLLLRQ